MSLLWIILFAPLLGGLAAWVLKSEKIAVGALLASLGGALACLFMGYGIAIPVELAWTWLHVPPAMEVELGLLLDPLSLIMLLVVTGVGSAIFIYSMGYMKGDEGYHKYFAFLSLFIFSMLGIVLANNFLQLFVFWELVGVSSYLLIGFWYEKPSAANAGNKAFWINRLADVGMLIGILLLWDLSEHLTLARVKTLNFLDWQALLPGALAAGRITVDQLAWAGGLLFCGVIGKSAQVPLHVWLPDAMEGPTPVSALIHAATMVAAGIYLICRCFFLFDASPNLLFLLTAFGMITTVVAGTMALVQSDLKRLLAYSTISQLGFMVVALGLGGRTEGFFHLTTHACFKALLFLGAGALIHRLHTQNIWEMRLRWNAMPWTFAAFLIGTLALAGVPPLAGFWSKDAILVLAKSSWLVYLVLLASAWMTAFYMGRAFTVIFLRGNKGDHPLQDRGMIPFIPPSMKWSMVALGLGACLAGFLPMEALLNPTSRGSGLYGVATLTHGGLTPLVSTLVSCAGLGLAYAFYGFGAAWRPALTRPLRPLKTLWLNKYYVDHAMAWLLTHIGDGAAAALAWFERRILIGTLVNGVAALIRTMGSALRYLQTGRVQFYAVLLGLGMVILLYYTIMSS